MKHFVVTLVVVLFLGCNTSESDDGIGPLIPLSANAIIGQWQLERHHYSTGGPGQWSDFVENGSIYRFSVDGKFHFKDNTSSEGNREGTFILKGDSLVLKFEQDSEAQEYTYSVEVSEQKMILSPTGPVICIEGCAEQFRRTD